MFVDRDSHAILSFGLRLHCKALLAETDRALRVLLLDCHGCTSVQLRESFCPFDGTFFGHCLCFDEITKLRGDAGMAAVGEDC